MDFFPEIRHIIIPEVEIELRIGSINNNKFDSSIDSQYFNKIVNALEVWNKWESVETIHTSEYIQNKLRLIVNEKNERKKILKINILNKNYSIKGSPFDIRISINQELRTSAEIDNTQDYIIRNKSRKSFISDTFKYDCTMAESIINNVKKQLYEIEVELIVNETTLQWSNQYINDFLICKFNDLVNIVEKSEDTLIKDLKII